MPNQGPNSVVILSGARADGAAGASAVSKVGGTVFVQDPAEAEFPDMPSNTIVSDHPDRVLPVAAIPAAVAQLVERLSDEPVVSDNGPEEMSLETSYAAFERSAVGRPGRMGEPSAFSCPACGDVLLEIEERASLAHRLAIRHGKTGSRATSERFDRIAGEALEQAELIRTVLLENNGD